MAKFCEVQSRLLEETVSTGFVSPRTIANGRALLNPPSDYHMRSKELHVYLSYTSVTRNTN